MKIFDRLMGRRAAERVSVEHVSVHTANLSPDTDEKLVIVTTTPAALEALRHMRGPVQLVADGARPVLFQPSSSMHAPVLDPDRGWILPISPATARELQTLPAGEGAHELTTTHLGLVLE